MLFAEAEDAIAAAVEAKYERNVLAIFDFVSCFSCDDKSLSSCTAEARTPIVLWVRQMLRRSHTDSATAGHELEGISTHWSMAQITEAAASRVGPSVSESAASADVRSWIVSEGELAAARSPWRTQMAAFFKACVLAFAL